MIVLKESVVMRTEDPSTILGIPIMDGYLGFMRIDEVEGDDNHELIYHQDGTLAENYILSFFGPKDEKTGEYRLVKRLFNANEIVNLFGFHSLDVEKLDDFIVSLKDAIPITVDKHQIDWTDIHSINIAGESMVIGNLYEYYEDIEDYELSNSYINFQNSPEYNGEDFDWWKENCETSYKRTMRLVPNAKESCKAKLFAAAFLAKLVPVIQKRYNMIHFDDAAINIANTISRITFMNDEGRIVNLSVTALESFFDRIRSNIRIGPNKRISCEQEDQLKKVYNVNV